MGLAVKARVTNTSDQPLTVPVVGIQILPGSTVMVPKWQAVKRDEKINTWLRLSMIAIEEIGTAQEAAEELVPEDSGAEDIDLTKLDREGLKAFLASQTVEFDGRASEEALRAIAEDLQAGTGSSD